MCGKSGGSSSNDVALKSRKPRIAVRSFRIPLRLSAGNLPSNQILPQAAFEVNPSFGERGSFALRKRFRRDAEYVPDARAFKPVDRNQRVRVIIAAEALERRTKGKGCKSGVLGHSGLRVLRSLLFDFCAIPTGRCCPSYETIREMTGLCYSTISGALKRLEESGLVRIVRRILRTPLGARQTSNAYAFSEHAFGWRKPDYENSKETANLLPVPLNLHLRHALRSLGRSMGLDDAEVNIKIENITPSRSWSVRQRSHRWTSPR